MCTVNWRKSFIVYVLCLCAAWANVAYGVQDAEVESAEPEIDAQTALEISNKVTLFQQELVAIESELGPYDVNLIEVLSDLGRFYMDLGQFQSAAEVFERAMSITRISDGLYSAGQLDILAQLISAYKAAGEWDQADDKEHLALHLNTRIYEPGTQTYAGAVLAFGEWKIQAIRGNLMQRSTLANMRDIERLQDVYAVALGLDQSVADASDRLGVQTRFDLLYAKAYAETQLAEYAMSAIPMNLERSVPRYVSEYVCRDVVSASGQVSQRCGTVRRENPQYREYEMQRQLYRDRIQIAVTSLDRTIDELEALLAAAPPLQTVTDGAAPARVEELRTLQGNINRNYRRSVLRW